MKEDESREQFCSKMCSGLLERVEYCDIWLCHNNSRPIQRDIDLTLDLKYYDRQAGYIIDREGVQYKHVDVACGHFGLRSQQRERRRN